MALPNKIFIDTDVLLDHLADRQPFAEYAHRILGLAESGVIGASMSALSFSNLYYILRKVKGHSDTIDLLAKLQMIVSVLPVGSVEVSNALSSTFSDFEDGLQYFCAASGGGIEALVTRNKADFSSSGIQVLTPDEFLSLE